MICIKFGMVYSRAAEFCKKKPPDSAIDFSGLPITTLQLYALDSNDTIFAFLRFKQAEEFSHLININKI